ncbi:MAG: SIMPL domain-containing protein, partial [Candidatus Bathyarchaeia archaeon]
MNGRIRVLDAVIVVALLSLLALNGFMVYRSLQLSAQPYALGRPLLYQAQDSKQKVIYVTGTGKASARPDIAVIYLAVKTQAEAASKAQSDNAATMSSVLEALKGSGVAESDLETTSYTLEPIMTYPENGTPRIVGYLCRNSIAVTVRDVGKAGAVIDAAVGAGANEVGSI